MANLLVVDKNKCIGCGLCSTMAPKTFKLDKNNKAEVIPPTGGPVDDAKTIQEAIDCCAVAAITLKKQP